MTTSRELLGKFKYLAKRGRGVAPSNDIRRAREWIRELWEITEELRRYAKVIEFDKEIKSLMEFNDQLYHATDAIDWDLRTCEEEGKRLLGECKTGENEYFDTIKVMKDLDTLCRKLTGRGCIHRPLEGTRSPEALNAVVSCLNSFIEYFEDVIEDRKKLIEALDVIKGEEEKVS